MTTPVLLRVVLAIALGLCAAAWPKLARAEVPISDQARGHFKRGVELLKHADGPKYREAYAAFQAAYWESPSPKILGNLGLCATKLERDGEAVAAYERYLAESGAVSPKEHQQILDDLIKLKSGMVEVRLVVTPLTARVLDERLRDEGEPVTNEYPARDGRLQIGVRQGKHRMTISADGYRSEIWAFDAAKGFVRQRTMELVRESVAPGESPEPITPDTAVGDDAASNPILTGAWAALGVTAALGVATGVVGGLSLANKSKFEDAMADGELARATELRNKGIKLNVATDALLGVTAAGAVVTVVLLAIGLGDSDGGDDVAGSEPAAKALPRSIEPRVVVGTGGAFLGLGARF